MKQPPSITWGESVLLLDNKTFAIGYTFGRFLSLYSGYSTHPKDAHGKTLLAASDLVGTLLLLAELHQSPLRKKGTGQENKLTRQFGVMIGYLSGPLYPETREEYQGWDAFFASVCSLEDKEGERARHELMRLSPWWRETQAQAEKAHTDEEEAAGMPGEEALTEWVS